MALCFSLSSREGGLLPPEENQNDLILLCSLLTHMPHILFSVTLMLTLVPVEGSLNFPDRSQSFSARSGIMCLTLPYRLLMENTHFLLLFAELAILPFFSHMSSTRPPCLKPGVIMDSLSISSHSQGLPLHPPLSLSTPITTVCV